MCGIAGIVSESFYTDELASRLEHMGIAQSHRGPDDSDLQIMDYHGRRVGLGFVRLSILDLETGMQPIRSQSDGRVIVCNGQVYNYVELKTDLASQDFQTRGDMEVALNLYRESGIGFLSKLNGMYAGAIFDPLDKRLLLFRDRFGIKPLYYISTSDGFFFASEIKALLAGSGIKAEQDSQSLPVFFSYRYVPGERTMFKGIRRLPPGSYLDYSLVSGEFAIRRYWDYLPGRHIQKMSLEDAQVRFTDILADAVRIRMRSDVEVASLLSGGVDSSSVASLAALRQPNIKFFTVSFEDPLYNELGEVKDFLDSDSGRFGEAQLIHSNCSTDSLNSLPDIVRSLEDCISLGTVLPTDQVCRLASEHVKVVLTGEGADEIFAGYRKFLLEMAAEEVGGMTTARRRRLLEDFPELVDYLPSRSANPRQRFIQSELLFNSSQLSRLLGRHVDDVLFPPDAMPELDRGMHPVNQFLAMECRSRLPDYVVLRLDKLSMRHSLETRTPYLDYRLAEFAADLPVEMKVNLARRMGKYICRTALDRFNIVNPETAGRRKKPFTIPMAAWLLRRDDQSSFARDILQGDLIREQGMLDPEMVSEMWSRVSTEGIEPDTLVSEADRVFSILTFTLWTREFLAC